jgi:hypothetical protein
MIKDVLRLGSLGLVVAEIGVAAADESDPQGDLCRSPER